MRTVGLVFPASPVFPTSPVEVVNNPPKSEEVKEPTKNENKSEEKK